MAADSMETSVTRFRVIFACVCCAVLASPGLAQDGFEPERVGVKAAIDPGPNVFINKQEWDGAGSINVYAAADLEYKGNMSLGSMGQILISPDGKTAYTQSSYLKRIVHGDNEQVLQVFDVATLTPQREVILPPKAALGAASTALLEQSADGRFIYVQNATPATSVTVVDIAAGEVVQELPTPGCWGVYPSLAGHAFSTICGDGSFASFALGEDGTGTARTNSEKIFDVDSDALFVSAERIEGKLGFVSFNGNLYLLDDSTGTVKLGDLLSFTEGVEGWAPGGYGVFGYNEANGVLFVTMHDNAREGSHKAESKEVWAYDVRNKTPLYRSPVTQLVSLTVTDDAVPVVYGLNQDDGKVVRFEADPEAKFVLKQTAEHGQTGFALVVTVRQ